MAPDQNTPRHWVNRETAPGKRDKPIEEEFANNPKTGAGETSVKVSQTRRRQGKSRGAYPPFNSFWQRRP